MRGTANPPWIGRGSRNASIGAARPLAARDVMCFTSVRPPSKLGRIVQIETHCTRISVEASPVMPRLASMLDCPNISLSPGERSLVAEACA